MGIILASHYSDSLDRLKLWEKIGTAVGVACAKAPECEPEAFITAALDNVKADPSRASRDVGLRDWLKEMGAEDHEWREGFVRYLITRRYAVMVFMRSAWNLHKGKGGNREQD